MNTELNEAAWEAWKEDQKTNPTAVNPHAYVYGFKSAKEYWYEQFKAEQKLSASVWVDDILEQVQIRIIKISQIHGKPKKASVIGNSIVLFFEDKSIYKQAFISKETTQAVLDENA